MPQPFHLSNQMPNQMPKDECLQGQVTTFSAQLSSSFRRKIGFSFSSWNFLDRRPCRPLETDCTEVGGLPATEGLALEWEPHRGRSSCRACVQCLVYLPFGSLWFDGSACGRGRLTGLRMSSRGRLIIH